MGCSPSELLPTSRSVASLTDHRHYRLRLRRVNQQTRRCGRAARVHLHVGPEGNLLAATEAGGTVTHATTPRTARARSPDPVGGVRRLTYDADGNATQRFSREPGGSSIPACLLAFTLWGDDHSELWILSLTLVAAGGIATVGTARQVLRDFQSAFNEG